MRVRLADTKGCPVPQIIMSAETVEDSLFIKMFSAFPLYAKDEWEFVFHGATSTDGTYSAMNFGLQRVVKEK